MALQSGGVWVDHHHVLANPPPPSTSSFSPTLSFRPPPPVTTTFTPAPKSWVSGVTFLNQTVNKSVKIWEKKSATWRHDRVFLLTPGVDRLWISATNMTIYNSNHIEIYRHNMFAAYVICDYVCNCMLRM